MNTAEKALVVLISVGALTMEDIPGTFPLLPARYHLAATNIKGILLILRDSQTENWQSFEFSRLGNYVGDAPAYPFLVSRICGEHYIEA